MSRTPPKITVVIPVYNTGKYLPACLDSVLYQSQKDFEIVAVNDASPDDSARILQQYAERDARIRIVTHERNKGSNSARLTGIRAAEGKYIMFLDSDDCFLPDVMRNALEIAEKNNADIVHFPLQTRDRNRKLSPRLLRLAEKKSFPYPHELRGRDVFRKFFIDHACGWSVVQKLYLTDICRKAADFIPDRASLMGEDFCLYTACAFFAEHYMPMKQKGYVYFMDSGISSCQKTTLDKFLERQSPIPALRIVRNFLERQNAPEEYFAAFAAQEQELLGEYAFRWMRYLPGEDRTTAFDSLMNRYDQATVFTSIREFFHGRDEHILDLMTGEDPTPAPCPVTLAHPCLEPVLQHTEISIERWQEWKLLIGNNHYDSVILTQDQDPERLFWDILAVRNAGASAVFRKDNPCLDTLERDGLKSWLIEDRIIRQASMVLTPDEESAAWYRKRNCHAGTSPDRIQPPQRDAGTSALMLALEKNELHDAYYRIDPSEDGETFVPFFRKLDRLFRKLPAWIRIPVFGFLAKIYNRLRGC